MSESVDFEAAFNAAVERAARELAGETEGAVSDHPEIDELVDYQEGRLDADDAQRVRRHLETCRECAREVRELESFDQAVDADLEPSPEQTAEDWARFQEQVSGEIRQTDDGDHGGQTLERPRPELTALTPTPVAAPGAPTPGTTTPRAEPSRSLRWLSMAASIMIGLVGVGLWIASQRTAPPEPTPRHPYAFDLVPDGEDRLRDAALLARVEVPTGMDALLARLNLGDQTPYDGYRAEIADSDDAVVWSQDGLRRQPAGQFVVLIHRDQLPADGYRLSVFGIAGDGETKLASYTFELTYAPGP